MWIEVDESELARVAAAVDAAAAVVAAADLTGLGGDVAAAMPGSMSATAAASAVASVVEALTNLVRALAAHADAVREAAVRYGDTDRDLTAAVCRR